MQESETEVQVDRATFIGECWLPWKEVLNLKEGEWQNLRIALSDPMGKCSQKVQGMVKVFSKWIPAGSERSKFDKNGNKKDA